MSEVTSVECYRDKADKRSSKRIAKNFGFRRKAMRSLIETVRQGSIPPPADHASIAKANDLMPILIDLEVPLTQLDDFVVRNGLPLPVLAASVSNTEMGDLSDIARGLIAASTGAWNVAPLSEPRDPRAAVISAKMATAASCWVEHAWDQLENQCSVDDDLLLSPDTGMAFVAAIMRAAHPKLASAEIYNCEAEVRLALENADWYEDHDEPADPDDPPAKGPPSLHLVE